jgi:hypothetical protein
MHVIQIQHFNQMSLRISEMETFRYISSIKVGDKFVNHTIEAPSFRATVVSSTEASVLCFYIMILT